MVAYDAMGSTTTDYGPKQPDPPNHPAAVAGTETLSWHWSVRVIEGLKYVGSTGGISSYGLEAPPHATEVESHAFPETQNVYTVRFNNTQYVWYAEKCTSPAAVKPGPFKRNDLNQPPGGFTRKTGVTVVGPDDQTGMEKHCAWGEDGNQHADFHFPYSGNPGSVPVKFSSGKSFFDRKNVSSTCTESYAHPYPGQGPTHHSFKTYISITAQLTYFPAPELIAKNDQIRDLSEGKGVIPKKPANLKPPSGFDQNPKTSAPCSLSYKVAGLGRWRPPACEAGALPLVKYAPEKKFGGGALGRLVQFRGPLSPLPVGGYQHRNTRRCVGE
ncbi:MAG: hypothetical protein WBB76_09965 [Gaiellaceae bacterium]